MFLKGFVILKNILFDFLYLINTLANTLSYFISGFSKRKNNRVILGSWGGHKISDNPRYLLDYLKDEKSLEVIWCGRKHLKGSEALQSVNIKFVNYNSLESIYYALTSRYVFIANTYRDVALVNLFKGAVVTQLWHGFGLKNTLAAKELSFAKKIYYSLGQKTYEKCDYFISSSELNTKKILTTFKYHGIEESKVVRCGQPKNDFLINNNNNTDFINSIRAKFKESNDIPLDKKLVLYLPTFRSKGESFSFSELKGAKLDAISMILEKNNAVLIEKKHLKDHGRKDIPTHREFIYSLESSMESQELLLVSDVLVTDYSSCYLDYTLLGRPIIHYAYDYDIYKVMDRGFFYKLEDLAAGPIAQSFEGLLEHLSLCLSSDEYFKQKRREIQHTAMAYETGESCNKILDLIVKSN